MEGQAQHPGHGSGVGTVVRDAALRQGQALQQGEMQAVDLVPGLLQQHRGGRAVHPAAHA